MKLMMMVNLGHEKGETIQTGGAKNRTEGQLHFPRVGSIRTRERWQWYAPTPRYTPRFVVCTRIW